MKGDQILVWNDKHGDYYFSFNTAAEKHEVVLRIIKDRLKYGFIYEGDDDYDRAKKAVDTEDSQLAWDIILDRDDYEYEGTFTGILS